MAYRIETMIKLTIELSRKYYKKKNHPKHKPLEITIRNIDRHTYLISKIFIIKHYTSSNKQTSKSTETPLQRDRTVIR